MSSHHHTCEVRGERCEGRGLFNGQFLDYNTPPRTRDGRLACQKCADAVDRNGVDIVTDFVYPGAKHWAAQRAATASKPADTAPGAHGLYEVTYRTVVKGHWEGFARRSESYAELADFRDAMRRSGTRREDISEVHPYNPNS